VSTARPSVVQSSHKVWIELEGGGFNQRSSVRASGKGVEVLETVYVSGKRLRFLIRAGDEDKITQLAKKSAAGLPETGQESTGTLIVEFSITGAGRPSEPFLIEILPCPVAGMAVIPAGPFLFGSDTGSSPERPEREIVLPAFACALTEVSNADYLEFLNYIQQTGDHSRCHPDEGPLHTHVPDRWDDPGLRAPAAPVTGVDWFDAFAYAAWKGWRLGGFRGKQDGTAACQIQTRGPQPFRDVRRCRQRLGMDRERRTGSRSGGDPRRLIPLHTARLQDIRTQLDQP